MPTHSQLHFNTVSSEFTHHRRVMICVRKSGTCSPGLHVKAACDTPSLALTAPWRDMNNTLDYVLMSSQVL